MGKCLENENDKLQKSLSRAGIIDARAHYWASARRLRSIALDDCYEYPHGGSPKSATCLHNILWCFALGMMATISNVEIVTNRAAERFLTWLLRVQKAVVYRNPFKRSGGVNSKLKASDYGV
jgi:hypothetical protein